MQVDALELEIKTNADAAANSIRNLRDALKGIRSACTSYAKGLEAINDKLRNLGSGQARDAQDGLTDTADAMRDVTGQAADLSEQLDRVNQDVADTGEKTKTASSKLGTFFKQIKRIAVYRAIRTALKAIANAFKEGVNNVALYDSAVGNIFGYNTALSSLSTAWQNLKNTLGVFAANIISAVAPALVYLMQVIYKVVEAVNALVAAFSGKSSYMAVNPDYWKDYASNIDSANGSAKELKKTLFGFDELNVLNDTSSSGSSSSSDVSDMFVQKDTTTFDSSGLTNFVEDVKKVVADVKKIFEDLQGYIPAIVKGDWDAVEDYTVTFLNNFSTLIGDVAQVVKDGIPIMIDFSKSTITGFIDWTETNITSLFAWLSEKTGINLTGISDIIVAKFKYIKETIEQIATVVKTTFEGICDIISAIATGDWETVWQTVKTVCLNILKELARQAINQLNSIISEINVTLSKINNIFGTSLQISKVSMPTSLLTDYKSEDYWMKYYGGSYATGGTPDTGSLFLAGEAGPELVTQIGGRSTVFNEEQLGSSMAIANESVVSAINTLIGVVRSKNTNVSISASDIRKAVNSSSLRVGV